MNIFRWPLIIFWPGRRRSVLQVDDKQKEKEKKELKEQKEPEPQPQPKSPSPPPSPPPPPIQRAQLSQSVVSLPKMVHFSESTFGGSFMGPRQQQQQPSKQPSSPYTSTIQHWLLSREPVYYAVPATVVNMAATTQPMMSMSTPNLSAAPSMAQMMMTGDGDNAAGRSLSLPPKPAAGHLHPPPLVIGGPLVYRVQAGPGTGDHPLRRRGRSSATPPTPPPRPRMARRGSSRGGNANQNGPQQTIPSDLLLLQVSAFLEIEK